MKKAILAILLLGIFVLILGNYFYSNFNKDHSSSTAKMLFVGDMMFDRTMRSIAEQKGYDYLFECVEPYLSGFDMVVGNMEGPITPYMSVSKGTIPGDANNMRFTFDPSIVQSLKKYGFGVLYIGNNHIFDFGQSGVESTLSALGEEGIIPFGVEGNYVATTSINGNIISFISFNHFYGESNPEEVVSMIWKAKKSASTVIVYAHWGNEYEKEDRYQEALAHRFVDAGADLIIGSHPHVIQGHEVYEGKNIYYSLGNFIFDQYWNEDVRTGLGVEVNIDNGVITTNKKTFTLDRVKVVCPHI